MGQYSVMQLITHDFNCLPPLAEVVDKRALLFFFLRRFQSRLSNVNIGRQYDLKTFFSLFLERVAVKMIDKTKLDSKTQRMVGREIQIMDSLCHPHLIR